MREVRKDEGKIQFRKNKGAVNITTVSTRREDKCARMLEFPFSVMRRKRRQLAPELR